MRAVSPNTGAHEIVVAEEQEEYKPLPVAYPAGADCALTAWVPSTEELDTLARALVPHLATVRNRRIPDEETIGHVRVALARTFRAAPIYVSTMLVQGGDGKRRMVPMNVAIGIADWMKA